MMGINKIARRRASSQIAYLKNFKVVELHQLGDFQECLYQVEAASSRLKRQDAASTLGSLFIENRLTADCKHH